MVCRAEEGRTRATLRSAIAQEGQDARLLGRADGALGRLGAKMLHEVGVDVGVTGHGAKRSGQEREAGAKTTLAAGRRGRRCVGGMRARRKYQRHAATPTTQSAKYSPSLGCGM